MLRAAPMAEPVTAPLRPRTVAAVGGAVCAAALSFHIAAAAGPPAYTATRLPSFGGTVTFGTGINSGGEIVGYAALPGDLTFHAFRWSGGPLVDLGTLGGTLSEAHGINDHGQIVGESYIDPNVDRPFLYSGGIMIDLGSFGGSLSRALDINDAGQIAGFSTLTGSSYEHAFVRTGGTMLDLGTLGGQRSASLSINAFGVVTGYAEAPPYNLRHAFVYSGGSLADLNVPGLESVGNKINSSGQVAGSLTVSMGTRVVRHAFLYSGGTTLDLDPLGPRDSAGLGLNDSGTVTGWSCDLNDTCIAFVYAGGAMYELNKLLSPPLAGISLTTADAINNAGQIVAGGCTIAPPTICYAYRLDPLGNAGSSATAVPVGSAPLLALLAGLLALTGAWRRLRRRSDL